MDPTIYIDDKKKLPRIDTITSLNEVASLFHSEFVPFFVSNCILFVPDGKQVPATAGSYQTEFILVSNYINTICVTILIFVSWKKGPEIYQKFAPIFVFILMITVYIVLPSLNIIS